MNKFSPISLDGTVVGLLFSKTGSEVREAVTTKIKTLDDEVSELKDSIHDVDEFLESKKDELEELDGLYSERQDSKDAQARPFRRQVDDVCKAWGDKEFEFNRETERLVGEQAVTLEDGFRDFSAKFAELDDIAEEINDVASDSVMFSQEAPVGVMFDVAGAGGMESNSRSMRRVTSAGASTNAQFLLPTEQDKAAARLNTLRSKVHTYRNKVVLIQGRISVLEKESDELKLISCHLKDEREYTLDLDRLSALGFEA